MWTKYQLTNYELHISIGWTEEAGMMETRREARVQPANQADLSEAQDWPWTVLIKKRKEKKKQFNDDKMKPIKTILRS